jgi:hypothetical protein
MQDDPLEAARVIPVPVIALMSMLDVIDCV